MAEKKTEQFYTRPPKLGTWESFKIFLWNSETHQFLGRTGGSWGKIILFYLLFYAALIGFFAAMLTIFYQTLDDKKPKWQLDRSLIGSNPGLGFRPMPPESNVESTLIWYKASDETSTQYWREQLNDFLKPYIKERSPDGAVSKCDQGIPPPAGNERVCEVQVTNWHPCTPSAGYNFNSSEGGPCIFLKLNKIFGWEPDYYSYSTIPELMPSDLKQHIKKKEDTYGRNSTNLKVVWVSCEGENPGDIENIGPIHYHPDLGFDGRYFPFLNVDKYLSPLVVVYFERPTRGVLINIECKAWAKNIVHDRMDKRGSVHFELMIDY
ncbi:hypothetical protein RN001_008206 [Aquatica leii]|uniref:Sodium/potassium-transporting ATPase subunit beta-2 n=1 Tax=Aquatica leii TaxID=1421715 RepID=A0AAN7P3Y3_9COLE|nr:hypothetical protein RN001_008206 [Aquatica leii]